MRMAIKESKRTPETEPAMAARVLLVVPWLFLFEVSSGTRFGDCGRGGSGLGPARLPVGSLILKSSIAFI